MNVLFRNFFYAIGLLMVTFFYCADPSIITMGDLVRLVQSTRAQSLVFILWAGLVVLDFFLRAVRNPQH